MRAFELYETTTRKPYITLRHLNRLKHIRRTNQKKHEEKMALLPIMYSGERLADEAQLKDEIGNEIEKAEIDQEQKSHIEDMALNAIKRKNRS